MAEPPPTAPHKSQDFDDKPPPYTPIAGSDFSNAYGPSGGYAQSQSGPQLQPHIFSPPPPVGYQMGPGVTSQNYGTAIPVYGVTAQIPSQIIVVGGCPACRIGVLEDEFTFCGICLAILLFPLGFLCCLAMKQRRCPNCGAIFG